MHRNKLSLTCFTASSDMENRSTLDSGDFFSDLKILSRLHTPVVQKKKNFGKSFLENKIQSTLVISTSVISNNRLSRRENLVLVLTQKSKIRLQNIVEKRRNCSWGAISPLFHNIFNIYF